MTTAQDETSSQDTHPTKSIYKLLADQNQTGGAQCYHMFLACQEMCFHLSSMGALHHHLVCAHTVKVRKCGFAGQAWVSRPLFKWLLWLMCMLDSVMHHSIHRAVEMLSQSNGQIGYVQGKAALDGRTGSTVECKGVIGVLRCPSVQLLLVRIF